MLSVNQNSVDRCRVRQLSKCVIHLCQLLGGHGDHRYGAVQFGKELLSQVSQTRPTCPLHDHPQTSLNLQSLRMLEPPSRWTWTPQTNKHVTHCSRLQFKCVCDSERGRIKFKLCLLTTCVCCFLTIHTLIFN